MKRHFSGQNPRLLTVQNYSVTTKIFIQKSLCQTRVQSHGMIGEI